MNGMRCYSSWVEESLKRRRISIFSASFVVLILFLILFIIIAFTFPPHQSGGMSSMEPKRAVLVENEPKNKGLILSASSSHRKLLKVEVAQTQTTENGIFNDCDYTLSACRCYFNTAASAVETNRIWGDDKCSKSDIVINQGPTAPLPNGIPTYTVEIMNVCVTGCDISGIHLSCGWFSSARLINPRIFKRLRFDDCLVNDGKPLVNGRTISFQYANTFRYPLSVSAVIC